MDAADLGFAVRPVAPGERALYQAAIACVRRYPTSSAGVEDPETAWDEVLDAIDQLLVARQTAHLEGVRDAGASGP